MEHGGLSEISIRPSDDPNEGMIQAEHKVVRKRKRGDGPSYDFETKRHVYKSHAEAAKHVSRILSKHAAKRGMEKK